MKNKKSIGSNIAKSATSHNRTAFIGSDGFFMEEIWKDIDWIKGFENLYQISTHGRIRALGNGIGNISKLKILKPTATKGYLRLRLYNVDGIQVSIHRLVATAFVPNPENKPEVNHKDCDKSNNYYKNLEWSTHIENQKHASVNNLYVKGELHSKSKLTQQQVNDIRLKYIPYKYSSYTLAKEYGVSRKNINNIINNKIWK